MLFRVSAHSSSRSLTARLLMSLDEWGNNDSDMNTEDSGSENLMSP